VHLSWNCIPEVANVVNNDEVHRFLTKRPLFSNYHMVCDFLGVRSGVAEDSVLLRHDVAQMCKRITTFRGHYFPTKGCDPIAHCYGVIFQR
jgi:hypothetical protein